MPNIEILTTFTKDNGKWTYMGQFQHQGQWIPLTGSIEKPESKSRFKEILREQVERQIREYIQENEPSDTFTIEVGGVFVNALS